MQAHYNHEERVRNYLLIDRLFSNPQKIIFFLGLERLFSPQNLFSLTQWTQGQKVSLNRRSQPIYSPSTLDGVEEHTLTISGGEQFVQILKSERGLTVSLNISEWKAIDESKKVKESEIEGFAEKSLFLDYIFQKAVKFECPIKAYAVIDYDRKTEREDLKANI